MKLYLIKRLHVYKVSIHIMFKYDQSLKEKNIKENFIFEHKSDHTLSSEKFAYQNVSIHINSNKNQFINECLGRILLKSRRDVEELTFLIIY